MDNSIAAIGHFAQPHFRELNRNKGARVTRFGVLGAAQAPSSQPWRAPEALQNGVCRLQRAHLCLHRAHPHGSWRTSQTSRLALYAAHFSRIASSFLASVIARTHLPPNCSRPANTCSPLARTRLIALLLASFSSGFSVPLRPRHRSLGGRPRPCKTAFAGCSGRTSAFIAHTRTGHGAPARPAAWRCTPRTSAGSPVRFSPASSPARTCRPTARGRRTHVRLWRGRG